jgi:hypothetical protein
MVEVVQIRARPVSFEVAQIHELEAHKYKPDAQRLVDFMSRLGVSPG